MLTESTRVNTFEKRTVICLCVFCVIVDANKIPKTINIRSPLIK